MAGIFRLRELRGSLGGATYNPFENPSVPLASLSLDSVLGKFNSTDSGESVSIESATSLPTVWRCVGLLSTVVASCDLEVYKNPGKKAVTVNALDPGNTATLYTPFELWELATAHLALWGNAFVRKMRDPMGRIFDLRPINPSRVKVKLDAEGNKVFLVKPLQEGAAPVPLTDWEVMHVPGLGYDGIAGLSPIDLARQTLGTAQAAEKLAGRFYSRGTQLTGLIKVKAPLASQEQADGIRQRWIQRNAGVMHSAEVAVLDAETDFQPLTIPPEHLQFLESRRWQTTEIARLWGIPPHLVGDVEKSTSWGAGIEEQNTGFVAYTIASYTRRIEQRVTREVVNTRGQVARFNLDQLLRGDMQERFGAYAIAIQWGWLTRNEARIKENLEPIDGLDEPLTPLNMQAGSVSIDPVTGEPTPKPKADMDGPLTTTVKPGSGEQQAQDESGE